MQTDVVHVPGIGLLDKGDPRAVAYLALKASESYNGWTNRETWAVHLHLTNDRSTSDYWADEIARLKRCADVDDTPVVWSKEEYVRFTLADRLKEEHENAEADIIDGQSLRETRACFADIGSLWRVDWHEIAKALIGDAK